MTKDNKQQKLSDSTDTAIAYSDGAMKSSGLQSEKLSSYDNR